MLNQLVQERLGQLELERLQLVATINDKDREIENLKAEIEKLKADSVDNESENEEQLTQGCGYLRPHPFNLERIGGQNDDY